MTSKFERIETRLAHIEEMLQDQNEEFLSAKQAATFLDISIHQIYRLTSQNRLPYFKPGGGKIYFRRSDLNAWILSRKAKTENELKDEALRHPSFSIHPQHTKPGRIHSKSRSKRGMRREVTDDGDEEQDQRSAFSTNADGTDDCLSEQADEDAGHMHRSDIELPSRSGAPPGIPFSSDRVSFLPMSVNDTQLAFLPRNAGRGL